MNGPHAVPPASHLPHGSSLRCWVSLQAAWLQGPGQAVVGLRFLLPRHNLVCPDYYRTGALQERVTLKKTFKLIKFHGTLTAHDSKLMGLDLVWPVLDGLLPTQGACRC